MRINKKIGYLTLLIRIFRKIGNFPKAKLKRYKDKLLLIAKKLTKAHRKIFFKESNLY